jgi:hypothetical protein
MQSAFENAERDFVLFGLYTESHNHFSCPEIYSMYGNFMLQTSRYTKTESVKRRISVDVRNSIAARSVTVGNVRVRGWMEEYSQCGHVIMRTCVWLIAFYACERVKPELWVWCYILQCLLQLVDYKPELRYQLRPILAGQSCLCHSLLGTSRFLL